MLRFTFVAAAISDRREVNTTVVMATKIRCFWCNRVIIEGVVASWWRYTCPSCKSKESSTGLRVNSPKPNFHQYGDPRIPWRTAS